MEKLYNYFFHYNPYSGIWTLVPRSKIAEYFNRELGNHKFITAKTINELQEKALTELVD